MSSSTPLRLPAVDAIKAIASQLIVLHHLALYGPMSETIYPAATHVVRGLRDYALMAVPAFLVVGGFLAARALLPRLADMSLSALPAMLWHRYLRLARPYVATLILVILCAGLARHLTPHADNPLAATLPQVAAHLFLLHDIVGVDALSAGVWYVAIDFQLFALLLALVVLTWPLRRLKTDHASLTLGACAVLAVLSLFWFNRNADLDAWALYFFGAYGLGILAERLSRRRDLALPLLLIVVLTAAALYVEWRGRILVAGVTALLLVWTRGGQVAPRWASGNTIGYLSRISYSLFLIHYPVSLLVGSLVGRWWPGHVVANAAGLLATWATSMVAATFLHRWLEAAPTARRQPMVAAPA